MSRSDCLTIPTTRIQPPEPTCIRLYCCYVMIQYHHQKSLKELTLAYGSKKVRVPKGGTASSRDRKVADHTPSACES